MHTPIPPKKKKDSTHKLELFGQTFYVTEYTNGILWGSRLYNSKCECIYELSPIYGSKENALRELAYVAVDIVFDTER